MHGGDNETLGDFAKIGIITVSDRASEGRYRDISGLCILEVRTLCSSTLFRSAHIPFSAECLHWVLLVGCHMVSVIYSFQHTTSRARATSRARVRLCAGNYR